MLRRAFTLVELMVVMTIIAILAGLLMPAVSRALSEARATSCRSRLSQLGHAVSMYCIDHGGCLPGIGDYTGRQFFGFHHGPTEPVDFSGGYLSRHVGNDAEIWQCPAFAEFLPRAQGPCTGYAYNYNYLTELVTQGDWWDPDYKYWWCGKREAVIAKHTTTVLFGDSATNWMGPLQENWYWTPPSQALPWGNAYTHFRHNLRANVLWADGHVTSVEPHESVELDRDNLGVICDTSDCYFDPEQ